MSVSSTRTTTIVFTGDTTGTQTIQAAVNASSPGDIDLVNLSSGFNSFSVPTGCTAVTIKPPTGNTVSITLKGITGDQGIPLHKTDPTSLAIDSSVVTIGLTAGNTITGVRLYWS